MQRTRPDGYFIVVVEFCTYSQSTTSNNYINYSLNILLVHNDGLVCFVCVAKKFGNSSGKSNLVFKALFPEI